MPVFTPDSAADLARKSHTSGVRKARAHPLAQIVDMQARLEMDVLSDKTSTTARAQVARAWKELECLKRVILGKPANTSQSIRSDPVKKSKTQSTGPIESVEEAKPSGAQASEASGK